MKIIHCADLHLESKMETNLELEKAKERKNEIILTFQRMVNYAKENDVKAIIIAGDMFDKKRITNKTKNLVKDIISSNSNIDFFYLKGNHDESQVFEEDEIPSNLKTFTSEKWTYYNYDEENITIAGIEFGKLNDHDIYSSLLLDKDKINIVVMHGQEVSNNNLSNENKSADVINLKELKNKNIDYLALGHIHTYKKEKLDKRGVYCYSGCLEGRGFDECNEKGFVLLNIENSKIESTFIPFAKRTIYEIDVDLTDANSNTEIENRINEKIKDISKESIVKIVFTGECEIGQEHNVDYFYNEYKDSFYALKIEDKPHIKIDYMKYKNDRSLKGEFIRMVLDKNNLSEEEKNKIIITGIKALSNEEL